MSDPWGVGCYEDTAAELAPVSDVAVAALRIAGGERVLDIACGTGNAALVAHRAGAIVTGLDSSPRLLEVARKRVPDGDFVQGDAAKLPFDDASFDAAVSVFGVIFARPAAEVVAEIGRVMRPGGRVAITTWPPRGPMFAAVKLMRQALARVRSDDDGPVPADWGDPDALETLLRPYGDVEIGERQLEHAETSPDDFWNRWERLHPMWLAARDLLEPVGEWAPLKQAAIEALRDGRIGQGATSPYLLAMLQRG